MRSMSDWSRLVILSLFAARPVVAHHSAAEFNLSGTEIFSATVKEFEWKNPHVFIQVDRVDDDGELRTLQIEADGVSMLLPHGWSPESLSPGDRVTVEAYPSRASAGRSFLGYSITKLDGTILAPNPDRYSAAVPESQSPATGIAGVWLPRWEEGFFALGSERWPRTEQGERLRNAPAAAQNPLYDCVPFSAPRIMVIPVHTEIQVLPDHVLINVDWLDVERVVYTDRREHPENGERTIQGHTTGYWEDGTLVMETTLFSQDSVGEYGFASGPDRRIEERLSLRDDGKTLSYEFILEDPLYLREPVTAGGIWDYRPDLEPSSVDCDLEAAQRNLQSVD